MTRKTITFAYCAGVLQRTEALLIQGGVENGRARSERLWARVTMVQRVRTLLCREAGMPVLEEALATLEEAPTPEDLYQVATLLDEFAAQQPDTYDLVRSVSRWLRQRARSYSEKNGPKPS